MSFRKVSSGFTDRSRRSSHIKSYSRYKPNGLDQNTVLEGSAIISSEYSSKERKSSVLLSKDGPSNHEDSWREKYILLQKTVQNLRKEIKMKENIIYTLNNDKIVIEESHKQDLERLKSNLNQENNKLKKKQEDSDGKFKLVLSEKEKCKDELKDLSEKIEALHILHTQTLTTISNEHKKELHSTNKRYHNEIEQIKNNHTDLMREKESKIEKLKNQMSESLNDSSKERHTQIDELVKELKRVSDEAEYVKSALRKFKTTNFDANCKKCTLYEEKLKELTLELAKKDSICTNLFLVCSKMEKQLQQKAELLLIWNTVKSAK
jgi:hypothetical protein